MVEGGGVGGAGVELVGVEEGEDRSYQGVGEDYELETWISTSLEAGKIWAASFRVRGSEKAEERKESGGPWTCVRAPSPPGVPLDEVVSFALTPSLMCVTRVPARKKTQRSTKGRFHGWMAWAMPVRVAATRPPVVRDFLE